MSTSASYYQRVDTGTELFIDALRGIAALMVLLSHSVDLTISRVYGWEFVENPPFWRLVRATAGTGEHWVWCFFVLSGFCIHLSIARVLREGRFKFVPYALARITRIYPLYLIGFGLAVVTYAWVPELGGYDGHTPVRQFWSTLFSLQILTNSFPGFAQSWSLSCEMIYYAAWPILLWVAKGQENRALKMGMIGSLALAMGIFILWEVFHTLEDRAAVDGVWTLAVLFVLWLAGAGLAISWGPLSAATSVRRWRMGIIGFLLSAVLLSVIRFMHYPSWATHVVAWAGMPGLVLLIAGARHLNLSVAPEWVKSGCRWLGLFSYPCYILHDQLLSLLNHFAEPWLPTIIAAQPLVRAGLYVLVVVPPLMWIGPAMERFFMNWRNQFLQKHRHGLVPAKS